MALSNRSKRVLIAYRSDGKIKPGGDVNLMEKFGEELAQLHHVDHYFGVPSVGLLRSYDVVLAANLDRPVEPAKVLRRASLANTRFVFYSLHHPYEGISAYLKAGVYGPRKWLAKLASFSPQRYEFFLWLTRLVVVLLRERKLLAVGGVRGSQRTLLEASTKFLVCSTSEKRTVSSEIGVPKNLEIVPHSSDFLEGERCIEQDLVVVPGRIESRKNQLLVIEVAKKFPQKRFVFVGSFSSSDNGYVKVFKDNLMHSENCSHVDGMGKEEFYEYLLKASVVMSASWFEVTSLIELFCVQNEIPLVASKFSYIDLTSRVYEFDPSKEDDAVQALNDCLGGVSRDRESYESRTDRSGSICEIVGQV